MGFDEVMTFIGAVTAAVSGVTMAAMIAATERGGTAGR